MNYLNLTEIRFAHAWISATDEPRQLLSDEYAFLSDLQRGEASPDWKLKRQQKADRFLSAIDRATPPQPLSPASSK